MPSGDIGFVILLVIHVASVISWMGAAVLYSSVIGPSISKLNLKIREDFLKVVVPKFSRFILLSSTSTVLAGITLLGYVGSFDSNLMPEGFGLLFLLTGAILGLVAYIFALTIIIPSSNKILHLFANSIGSTKENSVGGFNEEFIKLQNAITGGSKAVAVLLTIVVVLMISGTYL